MTYEEARKALEITQQSLAQSYKAGSHLAMEKNGLAIEALEKQIPKKPIKANYIVKVNGVDTLLDENEFTKCPSCIYKDIEVKHGQKCCHICGQALDWSDTE